MSSLQYGQTLLAVDRAKEAHFVPLDSSLPLTAFQKERMFAPRAVQAKRAPGLEHRSQNKRRPQDQGDSTYS